MFVLSSFLNFCIYPSTCESLQAQTYCQFQSYDRSNYTSVHFTIGVALWAIGFMINLQSDSILRNLRRPTKENNDDHSKNTSTKRYKIPHGGFFEYVSCANFFGEIIEWLGYAIASSPSVAPWSFWFFVCANLIPRGIAHHRWYLEKFKEDYPKDRFAVIPFIL